jgi:hypothetical protein
MSGAINRTPDTFSGEAIVRSTCIEQQRIFMQVARQTPFQVDFNPLFLLAFYWILKQAREMLQQCERQRQEDRLRLTCD